jgi:broad specificity phosphatase PhoE
MTPVLAVQRWLEAGVAGRTALALVRHGLVENPQGLRYGRLPDFHLSAKGLAQAHAMAAALHELRPHARVLVNSPLERAVETTEPIAAALGLTPTVDDRLIEAWSALDGRLRRAWLVPRQWHVMWNPLRPSWGEPFVQVAARAVAAMGDAEFHARGGLAVIVSHQSPIWLGTQGARLTEAVGPRAWFRLLPPWLRQPLRCGTGSATVLLYENGHLVRVLPAWRPEVTVQKGRAS